MFRFFPLFLAIICVAVHSEDAIIIDIPISIKKEGVYEKSFTFSKAISDVCPLSPSVPGDTPIADSSNCTRFILCIGSIKYTFTCPSALFFDPTTSRCEFEENIRLPEDYCEYNDMYYQKAHICDCNKFVLCSMGVPEVFSCPLGFRFNNEHGIIPVNNGTARIEPCSIGSC